MATDLSWLNAKITVLELGDPRLMNRSVLYTHMGSDLDSGVAVALARISNADIRAMPVCFVPANWDGTGLKDGDICIDIEPTGTMPPGVLVLKGKRDDEGNTGSATALVVELFVTDSRVRALIALLVELVDTHDSSGDAYLAMFPYLSLELRMFLNETGLLMFYRAIRNMRMGRRKMSDQAFLQFFEEFIGGFIALRDRQNRTGKFDPMNHILDLDHCLAIYVHQQMNNLTSDDVRPVFKDDLWTGVLKNGDVLTTNPLDTSEGSLFWRVMQKASLEERRLMEPLITLVSNYIKNRNPFEVMRETAAYRKRKDMIRFLGFTSLVAAFEGRRFVANAAIEQAGREKHMATTVFHTMQLIQFAGALYEGLRKNRVAAEEVHELVRTKDPRLVFTPGTEVVKYDRKQINNHRLNDVLANYYGVRFMVMVNGNNLGFRRADGEKARVNDPSVMAVIEATGELCPSSLKHWHVTTGGWFVGSGSASKTLEEPWPSKVNPDDLVARLYALAKAHPKAA